MNFFICLLRTNGFPVTEGDRLRFTEHVVSRGVKDPVVWEDLDGLSVLARRLGTCGPRCARVGSIAGVGDVRLDNPDEIARELPSAGPDKPHLELVLHAIARRGIDIARQLLGDFAFVAWDSSVRRLIAARDAFGVRALFHLKLGSDLVAFSSHASLLGIRRSINEKYIARYFVRSVTDEQTIFDSVDVIPAAHVLSVTQGRQVLQRYWSADESKVDQCHSVHDATEEFRTHFAEAVRRRHGVADGAVWSELSGGLDTSAVVCMSSWLNRTGGAHESIARTVTYADSLGSGDESEFVNAVGEASGIPNVQVRDAWPWRDDGETPIRTESPGPGTLFWFRERRRNEAMKVAGAQVLLSGFGGDHLLESNLHFFADRLASGPVLATLKEMALWAALRQTSFWRFAVTYGLVPLIPTIQSQVAAANGHMRIPTWVDKKFRRRFDLDARLKQTTIPKLSSGPLSRYQSGNIEHIQSIACGLPRDHPFVPFERRFPFLHRPLVELALRMRPELKVHPFARKVALREATRDVLPEFVRTRLGKGGVNTRMLWALSHEHGLLERILRDPALAQMGYVDANNLRESYAAALRGEQGLTVTLYNTLALESWILIETGRWPHHEGARSSTEVARKKEINHGTIKEAVPEACVD